MSNIPELSGLPEISFIENKTLEDIRNQARTDYVQKYEEIAGTGVELTAADPITLLLDAIALTHWQTLQYIDNAGKQNLLKYATGANLDGLAALKKITRKPAQYAGVMLRFSMTTIRSSATPVPAGTRVTNLAGTYFITRSYAEIPIGSLYVDVYAEALEAGEAANGLPIGTINTFVDPHPYIAAVTNTSVSAGGADIENDDDLTRRIYLSPSGYSTAGAKEAYEYWALQFRDDVAEAKAYSPAATEVVLVFMLDDGIAPSSADIAGMTAWLSADTRRAMTDQLTVIAPTEEEYDITLTYYISSEKSAQAASIQSAVNSAIDGYIIWQRKIGRDINPSELIRVVQNAGAKRVALTAPTYTAVTAYKIAKLGEKTVAYGGLEDD